MFDSLSDKARHARMTALNTVAARNSDDGPSEAVETIGFRTQRKAEPVYSQTPELAVA